MFKLKDLPKDVREKIDKIVFVKGENYLGEVYLDDGWVFEWTETHISNFDTKEELIDIVRNCTIRENL